MIITHRSYSIEVRDGYIYALSYDYNGCTLIGGIVFKLETIGL